jgi:hypothetical protein
MILGWQRTADRAFRILFDPLDFEQRARFESRWSFCPRRCYRTGRWIWGPAVRAEAMWTGPGEPITERRWLHRHEGLVMMLRRSHNGTV